MIASHARWMLALAALIAACETAPLDDAGPLDAALDAGPRPDSGPRPVDAYITPDGGPPPTGCDRLDASIDAGAIDIDAGDIDAAVELGDGGNVVPDAGVLDPSAFPRASGPGGPRATFTTDQLNRSCAFMDFGPTDQLHHNTGFMLDGYLVRAWAHERGRGGVAVFEIDDPCAPVLIANTLDEQIRETHTTPFSPIGGRWTATAAISGIQFWDLSDMTAPRMAHEMTLEGVRYPDAYMRTIMSIFWQAPYLYAGASDNGVFVIDATDPTAPRLVMQLSPEPAFRVGNVHAIGNLLIVMASEGSRVALYDISVPDAPRPIPGGSFLISNGRLDRFGRPTATTAYFGTVNGGRSYHARNGLGGGGLAIYDLTSPSMPRFVSNLDAIDGDGAYVAIHEDLAFVGESHFGQIIDIADPAMPREVTRLEFPGDFDTMTPLGNVVMISVDEDAEDGHATTIMPWREAPDARGPRANWIVPVDGAVLQAITSRVGLTFDEAIAMESVWRGSVEVRELGTTTPIEGWYSGQEAQINFWPATPLRPSTTYEVLVPAGGVTDISGNPTDRDFRATFTTASCGG